MSRILQRPMFKRGGTTNTGIMDGFEDMNTEDRVQASTGPFIDPLMRYDVAGAKTARDEAEAALRESAKVAEYDPTFDQGLALARAGFNIASAPGGRPITQILGEVGKESIDDFAAIGQKKAERAAKQAELDTSINLATFEQAQSDYNTARELASDVDIAQENKEKVSIILEESIRLRGLIADPNTSEAARQGYIDDLLQLNVQSREARIELQKDLPDLIQQFKYTAGDYANIVAQGDAKIQEYKESTGIDLTKYKGMTTDQIATEMAKDSINAIKIMEVRGAPLIGGAAAYGIVLAIQENKNLDFIKKSSEELVNSRPTAINLQWAVHRMNNKLSFVKTDELLDVALKEAKLICDEDVKFCENIGFNGLKIIEEIYNKKNKTVNILTHCNAGWLATIDWGTATSPIYQAHKKGIPIHVWVDETRPRNQGANLTSFELNEEGIPNTIITDNTGGILMQRGEVDMCIVGTDRTLSTGDVCNKIGTYLKALAAYDNNVPFYVALPSSTIDWETKDYNKIPIEERNSEELSHIEGKDEKNNIKKVLIYPENSKSMNLAFDITPAKYVTGLITEKGICRASAIGLKQMFNR